MTSRTSTSYLVDPSERIIDVACPICGSKLLEFDIPIFAGQTVTASDCPWCMTHREGPREDARDEIAQRMAEAGVPKEHRRIGPAEGWLSILQAGRAPYIHGKGRARSLMAYRFVRAWVESGGTARVITEYDLYTAKTDEVTGLYTVGLVVIDGLGLSRDPGDWGLAKLAAVVDVRNRASRPTIVTSELMPEALASRLGGYESGIGYTLESLMEKAEVVEA